MSEQPGEYITEARLLQGEPSIEISRPHTTIVRTGRELHEVEHAAFVKLSTAFKTELKEISGDALKVWLFIALSINRRTEQAHPGLRTISEGVNLAVNTVRKAITELETGGLLAVKRGIARYNLYEIPEYVSANRAEPTVSNRDTVPQTVSNRDTVVSNLGETVSPSVILNQRNQRNQIDASRHLSDNQKTKDILDGMIELQFKPKAVRDAFAEYFRLTPNWNAKYNSQFMEWAVEIGMTPEQVKRAADVWRMDKRFNWTVPNLRGIQEHWFELIGDEDTTQTRYEPIPDYSDAVPNPYRKG